MIDCSSRPPPAWYAAAPSSPALASDPPGSLRLPTALLGELVVPDAADRAQELKPLSERAARYASRARGYGTRRTYRSAWTGYVAWCARLGREPLAADPELVAMYVTHRADEGVAVSTMRVDLAAIRTAHLLAGRSLDLRDPRLAMVVEGITRTRGTRPHRQTTPAVPGVLLRLLAPVRRPIRHWARAIARCC
jgi:hypothetical protein